MTRILVPGGRILIYVWAKNQTNKSEMSSYLKQNKKNFKENRSGEEPSREVGEFGLPVHQNRTNFVHQVSSILDLSANIFSKSWVRPKKVDAVIK